MKSDTDDIFESIYTTIISNIQKFLGKGLGLTSDLVIDHTIKISKYSAVRDCNGTQTHNHLVCKRTLNHLAKLA